MMRNSRKKILDKRGSLENLTTDEKLSALISRFNLNYSISELKQMIVELEINDVDISIELLISKLEERRSELKYCQLYHDLFNFIQSPFEQIMKILAEAQYVLESIDKKQLAKSIEWVMLKIKNDEIYDIEYDNNDKNQKKTFDVDGDFESKKQIFNDFSFDVFSQTKKANLLVVKNNSNKRLTIQQNSNNYVRKSISIFSPLNALGPHETIVNLTKSTNIFPTINVIDEKPVDEDDLPKNPIDVVEVEHEEKKEQTPVTKNFETIESSNLNNLYKVNLSSDIDSTINNPLLDETQFDNINFNIFEYNDKTKFWNDYILNHISFYVFEKYNLFCLINESRFDTFLNKIKVGYDNLLPYHNHIHAADVLQTCNIYAIKAKLQKELDLTDLDISGYFLSAIIHDFKHPGLNNAYQINRRTPIANKYNDVSVLENFHVSSAFKVISHNNSNIFCDMTVEEYRVIRKRIIECVLATDMARHTKAHHTLKIKLKNFHSESHILQSLVNIESEESKFDRQQDILNFLLHCSDISNPTKKNDIYIKWTHLVIQEFHNQGDLEKQEKLPISFMCDRDNFNLPKSQIGFLSNIIFPCFSLLVLMAPDLDYTLKNLDENLKKWQQELEEKK